MSLRWEDRWARLSVFLDDRFVVLVEVRGCPFH